MVEDAMLHERLENAMSLATGNKEVKVDRVQYEKSEEKDNVVIYRPTVAVEVVEETASDEGWLEANPKGRLGNAAGRKQGRRRPALAKLNINGSEYSNIRESSYRREIISPAQKTIPRTITTELSATKQSNTRGLSVVEDSIKLQEKSCVPKTSCSSANLSAMASKSVSYKEVAVAPPGTVLKPLMEPPEESNEKEPETQTCSITNETSMEEINTTSVVDNVPDDGETDENHDHGTQSEKSRSEHDEIPTSNQEKSDETNGSKLSAAAKPFNPGALSVVHTLNSVSGTSIYDVRASQSMLADAAAPPLAARVPCGPRSPLYYRNTISYRMKQGLLKYQTPMTMPSRSMNPHAPEFVPRKAWQTYPGNGDLNVPNESNSMLEKSKAEQEILNEESSNRVEDGSPRKTGCEYEKAELARQIILSFIVNSVQHNVDSGSEPVLSEKKFESPSDAIANDSAIIKVLYGDEEKTARLLSQMNMSSQKQ
ncbi:hypothetical protein GH714_034178 [Hevea brasiliensis]|uniref:Uncharacterized protein n=1 Tax=Hevea brasiliensis TaxID=3981 RepID=A0A6A6NE91_HEVBR|nr:hypothetical protein GH714_034178 [Hevea brasiliensis]